MTAKKGVASRRTFLATLGAGGAVAAAVALKRQTTDSTPVAEPDAPQGKGYRLTEHVRNYYRTTKV